MLQRGTGQVKLLPVNEQKAVVAGGKSLDFNGLVLAVELVEILLQGFGNIFFVENSLNLLVSFSQQSHHRIIHLVVV
jgi:hypothetical protein